jgi:hypothetical protein
MALLLMCCTTNYPGAAKTWILRAFQINREQRFSAAEALQDPWLSKVCSVSFSFFF